MPRIVNDQRHTFDTNELFRRLSRESEIKYAGFQDRALEERQAQFQNACKLGRAEIAFVTSGTNFSLRFFPSGSEPYHGMLPPKEYVNFQRENGKVYLRAPLILNGVCVMWKGWINLNRLDGMGMIEYDEERAQMESAQVNSISSYHQSNMSKVIMKQQGRKHSDGGQNDINKRPRLL